MFVSRSDSDPYFSSKRMKKKRQTMALSWHFLTEDQFDLLQDRTEGAATVN